MAAKKIPTLPAVYLLTIVGPHNVMMVGTFPTAEAALAFAVENDPQEVKDGDAATGLIVGDTYLNSPRWSGDPDVSRVFGYRIFHFAPAGNLIEWADIQPFNEYAPGDMKPSLIDPKQVLDWN